MIILIIIFIISLLGIVIILLREQKKKRNYLLHSLAKSCNIDSVEFEERIQKVFKNLQGQKKRLEKPLQNVVKKSLAYSESALNYSKKNIRKKLFHTKQDASVSTFISEMKEIHKK